MQAVQTRAIEDTRHPAFNLRYQQETFEEEFEADYKPAVGELVAVTLDQKKFRPAIVDCLMGRGPNTLYLVRPRHQAQGHLVSLWQLRPIRQGGSHQAPPTPVQPQESIR